MLQPSKVFHAQKSETHVNVAYPIKPAVSCPVLPAYPPTLENSVLPKVVKLFTLKIFAHLWYKRLSQLYRMSLFQDAGIDISTIVAQRLEAIRRLSENPQDPVGTNIIQSIDSKVNYFVVSFWTSLY